MSEALLADRYSLNEPLGSGGMGRVWAAWDTALGRPVAIKLLAAPAGDPAAAQRFTDEAQAAARLAHAGIAALYDFGYAADGRPFLVMELVAGRSLAEMLLAHGRLAWETAADLGAQAARALAAAHAAGVVHRDIKPANLLVTDDDTLKVVDFGIAQLADHTASGQAGPVLGTAAYTAPELALHRPAGPAADLYALGCVLYELLAGQPPFTDVDAAQVLYRHVHEAPARLTEIRPDAPPELLRTVHALLAKNPANRPRDAAEAARQLQTVLTSDATDTQMLAPVGDITEPLPTIAEVPAPDAGRASRRRARPPLPLAGGLVAVGALFLTSFFLLLGGGDDDTTASSSTDTPSISLPDVTAETGQEGAPSSASPSASAPTRSATPSSTLSPSVSPTPSASVKQAAAQDPAALSRQLVSALAAQSTMTPDLYRDANSDAAQIDRKIQQGDADKAAEKARDLGRRLSDAQQKGKWDGDAEVMQLLSQLAASA